MPYTGPEDPSLPADIKKLSANKRRAFVHAFNSTIERTGKEESAFAVARAAADRAKEADVREAEWDAAFINDLPDSAFAYIEPGGEKDEEGKTKPRSLRHFPHHGSGGAVDLPHLRNALARAPQSPFGPKALPHLRRHAKEEKVGEFAEESSRAFYLAESGDLLEAQYSTEDNVLRNVTLLKAGWSKNGRYYAKEVVARAAPHFEGVRAFLDHPTKADERERPERSVRDLVGYYTNVRPYGESLIGDLKLVGEHAAHIGALAQETRNSGTELIGVSINAVGKTSEGEAEGRKGLIVEDIVRGFSADLVTVPAAGGGFQRLAAGYAEHVTDELLAAASYHQWRNANPDHIERLREELKQVRQESALREAKLEIEELQEQLAAKDARIKELEDADRVRAEELAEFKRVQAAEAEKALTEKVLQESDLPDLWYDAVRPQLAGKDEAGMRQVVEAEIAKLRALKDRGLLKAEVTGAGQRKEEVETAPVKEATRLLGREMADEELPLPGEDAFAYKQRINKK